MNTRDTHASPSGSEPDSSSAWIAAALAAVGALNVYVRTLAQTVTGEDSGELIAAAHSFGIAHPPGYPLWCLLAGVIERVVPAGSAAWRVAFTSALCAAGTVFLTTLLTARLTRNRLAGLAAGLALAFSFEFWEQSVIAEVYTLTTLCFAGFVLLLVYWAEAPCKRRWALFAFAFVYGLGMTAHGVLYFVAPVLALFVWGLDGPPWRRWRTNACLLGLALLGWCVHLYLPLRSAADPVMDWGNPETWDAFWAVVSREQYRFMVTEGPRGLARFLAQCGVFAGLFARQYTLWLCWAPVLGAAVLLWRGWAAKNKAPALLLLALFAVLVLAGILAPNFDLTPKWIWINSTYWTPAYVVAAVWLGAAVDAPMRWRGRLASPGQALGALLAASSVALPLITHYAHIDKSDYWFAADYSACVLDSMEEDAIYFASSDHSTFTVLYQQAVRGQRPDVLLANPYGYPLESLYADMPEEARRRIGRIPSTRDEEAIMAWVVSTSGRPVYFARKPSPAALAGRTVVNAGLLYRAAERANAYPDLHVWERYEWHSIDPGGINGDWSAGLILFDYYFACARLALDENRPDLAMRSLDLALTASVEVEGVSADRLNDCGSLFADCGLWAEARAYFAKALQAGPGNRSARLNLARMAAMEGDYAGALGRFDALLAENPGDAEALWLSAHCLTRLGALEDAAARFEQYAGLRPLDWRAYRELGKLRHKAGADERAFELFEKALELNPNQPEVKRWLAQSTSEG